VHRHEKPRITISLQFSLMMNRPSKFNFCSAALPSQIPGDTASKLTRPLPSKLGIYWREQSEPAQLCKQGRIGKPLNQLVDQSFLQAFLHPDSVAHASVIS
jgi:hypothetical protein